MAFIKKIVMMSLKWKNPSKLAKLLVNKLTIGFLLLSTNNVVFAQEKLTPVRVATKSFPPFVFEENGKYVGFSIDLWKEIAQKLELQSEIYGEETISDLLNSVSNESTDIGVAGITITSDREQQIDFSHPFFESGLQIMISSQNISPWQSFFAFIFSPVLWSAIGFLIFVIAIAAHLIWWLERKKNPEMFPEKYIEGIGEGFWWAVVTVVTVGYGDKTPRGVAGRILASIWMFTGILLISYFTASVTTALTLQTLQTRVAKVEDLENKSVGTVKGTTAEEFLQGKNVYDIAFDSIEDAYDALNEGTVNAIVYDAPVLRYYANNQGLGKVKVVGPVFAQQSYGIAVKIYSPYREKINQALLQLKEDGTYQQIYQKWFGVSN